MNEIIEQRADSYSRKSGRRRGSVEVELMMEEIDVERENNRNRQAMKPSQNDYRPNRVLQGSTRTSLVIRRGSAFNNQTFHRDELLEKERRRAMQTGTRVSAKSTQKVAAEQIQRVFRQWRTYLLDHREWLTQTRICAVLIQSTWRVYHVRRRKLDRAANKIQPVVRGFLVRNVCKKHAAAIEIQRTARGQIGRRRCFAFRQLLTRTAIIFQRFVRMMIAKRKSQEELVRKREGR